MKNSLLFILLVPFFYLNGQSYTYEKESFSFTGNARLVDKVPLVSEDDTTLIKNFKLNFAVPDQPAFKALGTESSNILRPSSSELVSFITSNFFQGVTPVLPNSFSLEIAPLMLIKSNTLTLNEYSKLPALYSTRISIGTSLGEKDSKSRNLGIGLRMTLIDKGDIKNNKEYLKEFKKHFYTKAEFDSKMEDAWFIKINKGKPADQLITAQMVARSDSLEQLLETYLTEEYNTYYRLSFNAKLKNYKKKFKKDNWNKQKLDVAAAILLNSEDSLIVNLKYHSTEAWVTWGLPVGKMGQILIGANYTNNNDYIFIADTFDIQVSNEISLSTRVYGGFNRFKGFIEGQYSLNMTEFDDVHNVLINGGTEFNIKDGIWINLSLGVDLKKDNTMSKFNSNLVGNVDLRFTLPENFNFF